MGFQVGQKVVCVDTSPAKCGDGSNPFTKGAMYTVLPRLDDTCECCCCVSGDPAHEWHNSRFRPLVEKSTDTGMAVLCEILDRESYTIKTPAKA